MRHWLLGVIFFLGCSLGMPAVAAPRVSVTFPAAMSQEPLTGRLLLVFSPGGKGEPRSQVIWDDDAIPFFGMDVEGWKPGKRKYFDAKVGGFPLRSLADLPEGEYSVQAVLNRYEKFTRSDGHTLWLPPDQGEGQVWHQKPGNLYSRPLKVRIDGKWRGRIELVLDQKIPPVAAFEDQQTDYVRYFRIRSERLSKFWGRDTYLAAWVRLPWGYHEHPEARYPLVIAHGHYPAAQADSASCRRTRNSRRSTASGSVSRATTASSRSTSGRRTRTGSQPVSRACSLSKSSTRRRSMTILMP